MFLTGTPGAALLLCQYSKATPCRVCPGPLHVADRRAFDRSTPLWEFAYRPPVDVRRSSASTGPGFACAGHDVDSRPGTSPVSKT